MITITADTVTDTVQYSYLAQQQPQVSASIMHISHIARTMIVLVHLTLDHARHCIENLCLHGSASELQTGKTLSRSVVLVSNSSMAVWMCA